MSIADDALTMFEGLGLLSADYGILDYLRGHYPELVNQREQHLLLKFTIPRPTAPTVGGGNNTTTRLTTPTGIRSTTDATVKVKLPYYEILYTLSHISQYTNIPSLVSNFLSLLRLLLMVNLEDFYVPNEDDHKGMEDRDKDRPSKKN